MFKKQKLFIQAIYFSELQNSNLYRAKTMKNCKLFKRTLLVAVLACCCSYTHAVISQQAYIKASNTDDFDFFGNSLAISGNTLVVAAFEEQSAATGINGDENDNSLSRAGAVYVYTLVGNQWVFEAYIKASNTDSQDNFGSSVAIDGDTIVVGARYEASSSTDVNGDENNNLLGLAGAAYVFVRNAGVWSQQAYLKASNTGLSDIFGASVAIDNDTIVVGATGEDSNATGVNGDETDNSNPYSGAAYVFTRTSNEWSQQAYLKSSAVDNNDNFGVSVALDGDTIVVGAAMEGSNATGINGDDTDNSALRSGAAYVFIRNAGSWQQQAYIKASNSGFNDEFGRSLAISGDTIIVGAWSEASNASGINGDEGNNSTNAAGAAYIFTRSLDEWGQQAYIKASDSEVGRKFGWNVDIDGNTAVVGAKTKEALYVFSRNQDAWQEIGKPLPSNYEIGDLYSMAASISGNTLLVGAKSEDSSATGVGGDEFDNSVFNSGAAYLFHIDTDLIFINGFE